MTASGVPFVKGHGTENDFVVLPDLEAALRLTAESVAAICDRHAGIGADGVLRVVPARARPAEVAEAGDARWFMDYRNADGSLAEMCGNGIRVFARYLVDTGLAEPGRFTIATRGGVRTVELAATGPVTVDMGRYELPGPGPVRVHVGRQVWDAVAVAVPNPHAVAFVGDLEDAGDLRAPPTVTPANGYPAGVNVEFVVRGGPGELAMRVHERGSGETRSCGTGACAAAVAAARRDEAPSGWVYIVNVPGGRLSVHECAGAVRLTGPAVLVADGYLRPQGWRPGPSGGDNSSPVGTRACQGWPV